MSYHIPSDEQVERVIKKILKEYHTINSQQKLKLYVLNELNKKRKNYGVSQQRIRKVAINSDFVKVEIHSREGDPKKLLNKCPVCDNILKKVKNLTIWGGEVTLEFRCNNCGYWTGKRKRVPTRYIFYLKK
jgi:hypothetical protein